MGVRLKYRTVVLLVSPAHFGWLRGGFRHRVPLKLVDEFADTPEVPPFYKKQEKITMRHMENTSDSIALLRGHIDPRRVQRRTPLKRTLLEFSMSKFQPLHTRIGIRMFVRSYCCITLQFDDFCWYFTYFIVVPLHVLKSTVERLIDSKSHWEIGTWSWSI